MPSIVRQPRQNAPHLYDDLQTLAGVIAHRLDGGTRRMLITACSRARFEQCEGPTVEVASSNGRVLAAFAGGWPDACYLRLLVERELGQRVPMRRLNMRLTRGVARDPHATSSRDEVSAWWRVHHANPYLAPLGESDTPATPTPEAPPAPEANPGPADGPTPTTAQQYLDSMEQAASASRFQTRAPNWQSPAIAESVMCAVAGTMAERGRRSDQVSVDVVLYQHDSCYPSQVGVYVDDEAHRRWMLIGSFVGDVLDATYLYDRLRNGSGYRWGVRLRLHELMRRVEDVACGRFIGMHNITRNRQESSPLPVHQIVSGTQAYRANAGPHTPAPPEAAPAPEVTPAAAATPAPTPDNTPARTRRRRHARAASGTSGGFMAVARRLGLTAG